MQTQISLNTLKLDHERFDRLVNKIDQQFSWRPVTPKDNIETIMYRAGQASVIEYMKSLLDE